MLILVGCSRASSPKTSASAGDRHASAAHEQSEGLSREEVAALEETTAYEDAKPVFERYCSACHSHRGAKASPEALAHFSMDTYPFGGDTEMALAVPKVLGAARAPATMPKDDPGGVQGADLEAILVWAADAYVTAHGFVKTAPPEKHEAEQQHPLGGGSCH